MTPNEWQEKVDITYTNLIENHLVSNAIQLEYIYLEYCQLCKKVSEALSLLKVRQFLTELHFSAVPSFTNIGLCYWQQAAFPLSAHELYHEISKELIVLARDFFRESKGFLNDFTRYCGIILPEVECRGITFGSFGRCVKRCTTPKYFNELESNIQRVLEPFSRKGLYIDNSICFYRDKFVEHNDSLTYPELLTGPEQLQLVHPSPSNNNLFWVPTGHRAIEDEYKVRTAFIPPSDMLFLRGEHNQLWLYLHLNSSISVFSYVEEGQAIGYANDSTKLHFKKYGPHIHIFPPVNNIVPPQHQNDYVIYNRENWEVRGMSPNVISSFNLLSDFFYDVLKRLGFYLQSHQ